MLSYPSQLARDIWPTFPNVSILRGDLIHPVVSGNKLFKVDPIVRIAQQMNKRTLISVGGRFSNHLHALSFLAREQGFHSVGIVRGYAEQELTPTLLDCQQFGMKLHFVNNTDYQNRYEDSFWGPWLSRYPDSYRIDEGGWSKEAMEGSASWWNYIPTATDFVLVPIGSGSTFAGLMKSAPPQTNVVGVPAFLDTAGYRPLYQKFAQIGLDESRIQLWAESIQRGFGKLTKAQQQFKTEFEEETQISLDTVYNTKTLYTLNNRLLKNPELRKKNIVVIHTGGTQGNRS